MNLTSARGSAGRAGSASLRMSTKLHKITRGRFRTRSSRRWATTWADPTPQHIKDTRRFAMRVSFIVAPSTAGVARLVRSQARRASRTQMVALKDEHVEPLAASQFQPPSGICSSSNRPMMAPTSSPKYAPTAATCPLMHGSTSPAKNAFLAQPAGAQPAQVTRSRTRPSACRAGPHAGSRPQSRKSMSTCMVESQPRFHAAPPHRPSGPWALSRAAPQPS